MTLPALPDSIRSTCRPSPRALVLWVGFLVFLNLLAGCSRQPAAPAASDNGIVDVKLGSKSFHLEVVATKTARNLGLMYRKSLAEDAGMIFVFPYQKNLSFWMRNTDIPLDIAYLDGRGEVVSIKQMEPRKEEGVPSEGSARFAIELNQGMAAKVGLKVGDVIDLPNRVKNPPDLEDDTPS